MSAAARGATVKHAASKRAEYDNDMSSVCDDASGQGSNITASLECRAVWKTIIATELQQGCNAHVVEYGLKETALSKRFQRGTQP